MLSCPPRDGDTTRSQQNLGPFRHPGALAGYRDPGVVGKGGKTLPKSEASLRKWHPRQDEVGKTGWG